MRFILGLTANFFGDSGALSQRSLNRVTLVSVWNWQRDSGGWTEMLRRYPSGSDTDQMKTAGAEQAARC